MYGVKLNMALLLLLTGFSVLHWHVSAVQHTLCQTTQVPVLQEGTILGPDDSVLKGLADDESSCSLKLQQVPTDSWIRFTFGGLNALLFTLYQAQILDMYTITCGGAAANVRDGVLNCYTGDLDLSFEFEGGYSEIEVEVELSPLWLAQRLVINYIVGQIVAPLDTTDWQRNAFRVTATSGYVVSHPGYPFGKYAKMTRSEIYLGTTDQAVYGFNVTFLNADIERDCNKDYVMIENDDLTIIDCWCSDDITAKGLDPTYYNTTNITIRFITDMPGERNGFLLFYQVLYEEAVPTTLFPVTTTPIAGSSTNREGPQSTTDLSVGGKTDKISVTRTSQSGLVAACVILAVLLISAVAVFSFCFLREQKLRQGKKLPSFMMLTICEDGGANESRSRQADTKPYMQIRKKKIPSNEPQYENGPEADTYSYVHGGTLNTSRQTSTSQPSQSTAKHISDPNQDDRSGMIYYSEIPEAAGRRAGNSAEKSEDVYHLAADSTEGERASHTYDLAYDSLKQEDENNYYFSLQPENSAGNTGHVITE